MKISKAYFRLCKKVLKSKLNDRNLVKGVDTLQCDFRYLAAFISWRKNDLQDVDRKTSKLITICYGSYPKLFFLVSNLMEVISFNPETLSAR